MSFPIAEYQAVLEEAVTIVKDRCAKGRNEVVPWAEKFCHGSQDVVYELHERICRIRGAEKISDLATMRADAIDAVNEAVFLVMLLDREMQGR